MNMRRNNNMEDVRLKYVEGIKDGCQFISDMAEDIVGDISQCYDIEIKMSFIAHEVPNIEINKSYFNVKKELL